MPAETYVTDTSPPWQVFPFLTPDGLAGHLRQGIAEPWFDQVWRPFWAGLSVDARAQYLDHWQATPEWKAAIKFYFEPDPEFDAEADARESELYLKVQREQQKAAKPSFLDRLLGKRG